MTAEPPATRAADTVSHSGPLEHLRVVELAGIGPAPFCGMMLADLGADVVRVEGPTARWNPGAEVLCRNRRSVMVDLKHDRGPEAALSLIDRADVLLEGFRPGVIERLGIGPDVCLARNPGLVIGRVTGWGQHGPWATMAGHDINYLAVTGVLDAIGRADGPPQPPMNLLGDFGGGGMLLLAGILSALLHRQSTGAGQVVDAAIVDGSSTLAAMIYGMRAAGEWDDRRGANLLDTGAPFYDVYETADGKWMAVGALEPQFFAELVRTLELEDVPAQHDRKEWPRLRAMLRTRFLDRDQSEWAERFAGSDACVTPVLAWSDAGRHPHLADRATVVFPDGTAQPAPAPRFSGSHERAPIPPPLPGQHSEEVLRDWKAAGADDLVASGAVLQRRDD